MKKYVISIDAGGTNFKSAIVSSDAEIVGDSIMSVSANNAGPAEIIREGYRKTLYAQLKNAEKNGVEISAVAIDTPGPFDYENGYSLMTHKFKSIYKLPLRPWIEECVGKLPVTFVHDSAAFLSGEMWNSPYGDYKNAAGVMIGTGLGFATMKDRKILRLEDGSPLYVAWNKPYTNELLPEGRIAEDYVSGRGISARYPGGGRNARELEAMAFAGDKDAAKVYADTGTILGDIIAPFLSEIEAEILILGGQISRALPLFEKELADKLSGVPSLQRITKSCRLDTSHMLGAAYDCFLKIGF